MVLGRGHRARGPGHSLTPSAPLTYRLCLLGNTDRTVPTMSLADEFDALLQPQARTCQVCHLLSDSSPLDPDLRAKFAAVLTAGVGAATLAKVMRANGYLLPKQHVYDHRNDGHGA